MRRLARRLFPLCLVVSLLLCVAACVLWASSLTTPGRIGHRWTQNHADASGGTLLTTFGFVSVPRGIGVHLNRTLFSPGSQPPPDPAGIGPYQFFQADGGPVRTENTYGTYASHLGGGELKALGLRAFVWREGPLYITSDYGWSTFGEWSIMRGVVVPHWMCVTVTAVPAAWWLVRRRRLWRRARENRCLSCGYDLRATPARCPECGATTGR
jgi:hypothetical protein